MFDKMFDLFLEVTQRLGVPGSVAVALFAIAIFVVLEIAPKVLQAVDRYDRISGRRLGGTVGSDGVFSGSGNIAAIETLERFAPEDVDLAPIKKLLFHEGIMTVFNAYLKPKCRYARTRGQLLILIFICFILFVIFIYVASLFFHRSAELNDLGLRLPVRVTAFLFLLSGLLYLLLLIVCAYRICISEYYLHVSQRDAFSKPYHLAIPDKALDVLDHGREYVFLDATVHSGQRRWVKPFTDLNVRMLDAMVVQPRRLFRTERKQMKKDPRVVIDAGCELIKTDVQLQSAVIFVFSEFGMASSSVVAELCTQGCQAFDLGAIYGQERMLAMVIAKIQLMRECRLL